MEKPSSEDEAREWLAQAARYLQEVPYSSAALRHTAAAIDAYLNGDARSLEAAFGLKTDRRRGASANRSEKNFDLARRAIVFRLRQPPMPWEDICSELSYADARELRRLCDTYRADVIQALSAEVSARLNDSDDPA
jgi:hypothetical protein